jgi:hypothetical protein
MCATFLALWAICNPIYQNDHGDNLLSTVTAPEYHPLGEHSNDVRGECHSICSCNVDRL